MTTDTRRRVKLYALNADRQWDDRGTGHVASNYVDRLKGISLIVRAESDGSLLLESKIQPDTAYQKQQDTLIVWSEGDNFDLALSFQEKAGCDEIWEKICQVQGKDPSVEITQDIVEESEDERFDEMSDSAPPIELPPCELARLEDISEVIAGGLISPLRKEKLAIAIETDNYIKKLLYIFNMCEDMDHTEGLTHLFEIFKNIFLLNKNALFEIMFAEDTIFDVVGCLEYDPTQPQPKKHRQYLEKLAKFREAIPIKNKELLAKIHQTYRVQYIQDIVLPTPSVFEENMLNTLSSFIFFNKVEIVTLLQEDEKYLIELFSKLTDAATPDSKRRDLVLFLKEFCSFAQNLQPPGKDTFYKTLTTLGVLPALEITLAMNDKKTKSSSIDILTAIVEYSPYIVRDYTLQQVNNADEEQMLINIAIEQMLSDSEPELGGAVQLMGVIRILLDPENMIASVNKSEKTDFLNFFYKHSIQTLIAPLLLNTLGDKPINEDYHTVQLLGLVLELLSFCVEHHTYHIKNCILQKDLLRRILVLMKSTHTFLVLGALRFLRKIIALKDEFYNRHIVKGNLIAPVVDAFIRNNGRYNLLESAILELFEFIKLEDVKSLCTYVVENFGKIFDDIEYVQTFKSLKTKYDQHQDRLKDRDKGSLDNVPAILRATNRYRRDQRQLEEEEEIWFNDEDDFTDVTSVKPEYDTTIETTFETFMTKGVSTITTPLATDVTQTETTVATTNATLAVSPGTGGSTTTITTIETTLEERNITHQSEDDEHELATTLPNQEIQTSTTTTISGTNTISTITTTSSSITSSTSTSASSSSSSPLSSSTLSSTSAATTSLSSSPTPSSSTSPTTTSTSFSLTSQQQCEYISICFKNGKANITSTFIPITTTSNSNTTETPPQVITTANSPPKSTSPQIKRGLVDYEGDSDEEDEEETSETTPVHKKSRLV